MCKDEIWPRRRLQSTYKRFESSMCLLELSKAHQSPPKPHKLTPPPRASQQAVSLRASGVRYTDGHYTCPTADIRGLRAAGYDSSSSRQTIRYQRCGQCSAETQTAERQTSARCTARPLRVLSPRVRPPSSELLSFCESSYNLRRQLFHAPAA
jgi:hypothetical protein